MKLADQQRWMTRALGRLEPVASDPELARYASAEIAGGALSPVEHVELYRRQIWLRHLGSLEDDLPATAYVLGEEAFERFVAGYLSAHPPAHPSLRELSSAIARYAEGAELGKDASLVRDLVRYELAFVRVFDGADPTPIAIEPLLTAGPQALARARVELCPLVELLALEYPVHGLRRAVRAGERPALPAPRPTHLALYRANHVVSVELLDPIAFGLLEALGQEGSLERAAEALCQRLPAAELERAASQVGSWFQRFAALGFFASVRFDGAPDGAR